jgi:hypothetical protein
MSDYNERIRILQETGWRSFVVEGYEELPNGTRNIKLRLLVDPVKGSVSHLEAQVQPQWTPEGPISSTERNPAD